MRVRARGRSFLSTFLRWVVWLSLVRMLLIGPPEVWSSTAAGSESSIFPRSTVSDPYWVSTLLGSRSGYRDGVGTNALFVQPSALGQDEVGDIWIAESVVTGSFTAGVGGHRIRKYSPRTGLVVTVAGDAQPGLVDGPGAVARFRGPSGFAFGADGSVYLADRLNHRIRRIGTNGVVTTFAGRGPGLRDGALADARFYLPMGLAMDGAGNLYVADFGSYRVRRISPAGEVRTWAGGVSGFRDGAGLSARFSSPSSLASLPDGSLLVGDWENGAVRRISKDGVVETLLTELGYVERVVWGGNSGGYVVHSGRDVNGRLGVSQFDLQGNIGWSFAPVIGLRDGPVERAYMSRGVGDVLPLESGVLLFSDVYNHRVRGLELLERATLSMEPSSGLYTNQVRVVMSLEGVGAEVRYTVDGSEPTVSSALYRGPVVLEVSTTIRARAFLKGIPRSVEETRRYDRVYALTDQIPASWMVRYFGAGYVTDPRVPDHADPDGDGYTNVQEWAAGTDPLDIRSFPFVQSKPLDFDGDGNADLLLQSSGGFLAAWFMKGDTVVNASSLNPPETKNPDLLLVGVGDFNRDQKPDLLFQYVGGPAMGAMEVWFMDGVKLVQQVRVEEVGGVDGSWRAVGVGDYDFDGYPDVVGQAGDGLLSVKFVQDGRVKRSEQFSPEGAFGADGAVDPTWRLVGNADLDRDGRMDLIFQKTGGFGRPVAVWMMNGLERVSSSLLQPSDPGSGWTLVGTGDFSGDGREDFLFQHDDGKYGVWMMNGINRIRRGPLTPETAGPGWRIAGPR